MFPVLAGKCSVTLRCECYNFCLLAVAATRKNNSNRSNSRSNSSSSGGSSSSSSSSSSRKMEMLQYLYIKMPFIQVNLGIIPLASDYRYPMVATKSIISVYFLDDIERTTKSRPQPHMNKERKQFQQ